MRSLYDFAIIGGGIVGLAAAHAIRCQNPAATLIVLEKEQRRHSLRHLLQARQLQGPLLPGG
jgi:L-2-hydroxyglutarate oxidase